MNKFYFCQIKRGVKCLAFACAAVLLLTASVPSGAAPTSEAVLEWLTPSNGFGNAAVAYAAEAPAFATKYTSLYENDSHEGVYTYTVKHLKKGYKVKWSLSGPAASYLTLKKTSTTASGAKSSNKVTVDTLGLKSAKNKKATLTARVYDKKGKLVRKIADNFTIKVNSSYLQIKTGKISDSLKSLSVNKSYDFDCSISPANATSQLYWKVKNASGADCPGQISPEGIWTPTAEGAYSICAYTKNSANGRVITKTILPVTVGSTLKTALQTASDAITVTFNGDMKDKISLNDFSLTYLGDSISGSLINGGTTGSDSGFVIPLKELSLSEDGKTATLKISKNLTHDSIYRLGYKGKAVTTFTASAGKPASGIILTTESPVGLYRDIKYALYDENGIDVTSIYNYSVTFNGVVPSGHISSTGSLFMDIVGEYASVTMTCQTGSDSFTASANILCSVEDSSEIRTTITSTTNNPVYEAGSSVSENSFYLGDTAYFHFEILDEKGQILPYSSLTYIPQDSSIFTIAQDGKLTGKKAGTTLLSIHCMVNNKPMNYRANVTVLPRRTPSQLTLSETNITMSNAEETAYKTVLSVTAYDQYLNVLNQNSAIATIREENNQAVLASYDPDTGTVTISAQGAKPGSYTYTLSLLLNGSRITTSFVVTVLDVPEKGIETWQPEADTVLIDTSAVTKDSSPLTLQLHLAHYIDGVFAGYAPIQSASVKTSDGWYSDNLTTKPSQKARKIYPQDNQIVLTAAYWSASDNAVVKANPGVYTVNIKYYRDNADGSTTLETAQIVFIV